MRLSGKVVLITGSTGIGAATAHLAAKEGARVFVAALEAGDCAGLEPLVCDLREPEAAGDALAACLERFGRIDALFNVAGISGRRFGDGPVDSCTDDAWEQLFESNVTTAFRLCRAAIRHWLEQPVGLNGLRGSIVNLGSVVASSPAPEHFATHAYAAGKGAIEALSRAMAAYYAPLRIRVNVLAPGLVATPMSARAQKDPEILAYAKKRQPLSDGILHAGDVAQAAVFLISDESRHMTGQLIRVDGGWSVR